MSRIDRVMAVLDAHDSSPIFIILAISAISVALTWFVGVAAMLLFIWLCTILVCALIMYCWRESILMCENLFRRTQITTEMFSELLIELYERDPQRAEELARQHSQLIALSAIEDIDELTRERRSKREDDR